MNILFQSTRRRLAVWYTIVTGILLLLFATGVYLYVRYTLIDRIDDTLKHVIEVVERSIVIQPIAAQPKDYKVNVVASFRYNVEAVEDDRIDLEWFNPEGELLWSTFAEPLDIPLHFQRQGETVTVSRERIFRQIVKPIKVEKKTLGYLRVSHPWFEVTRPIRQLTRDLIIGIGLMVLSVGAIGWWLSGIAIQPVKDSYSSLKQFTADASHELRNPIATIQTNVQMALAYPEAEPQLQQQQLRVIERLTQRLGRLVNDLLFLARSDSGIVNMNWQDVPLDGLLIEVIEEQRTIAAAKNINLNLEIIEPDNSELEDIFVVKGDEDSLARLFTNLIANAIEHSNDSSKVEIELSLMDKPEVTRRGREHGQNYVQVKVKDTGKGIPETALTYIFDRFYRVDPARSRQETISTGAGLGLAIAKAIVENHQGQIAVESKENQGTTFTVILAVK
ncbi:MAG: HAMP domain-containing sensor histidine kinase [Xenococcaceae cyanobacterium MO_234.B1]|nr:HAMP domain-containing sensor histidine kinase [Xenococcaceae cyanobacterium MO_234.B1]